MYQEIDDGAMKFIYSVLLFKDTKGRRNTEKYRVLIHVLQ